MSLASTNRFHFTTLIALMFLTALSQSALAEQTKFYKDLDGDGIDDIIYLDKEQQKLICQLSSQQFAKIMSQSFTDLETMSDIKLTKNGFTFNEDWMRAGYSAQFRYEPASKRIRLIGMQRYELGNAANDGSGESSVNLLTQQYIGNWNYFDLNKDKLVKIPTIKTKMVFPKIYLEDFNEESLFDYGERCSALYVKHKNKGNV